MEIVYCAVCEQEVERGFALLPIDEYGEPIEKESDYCSVGCLLTFVLEMQRSVEAKSG